MQAGRPEHAHLCAACNIRALPETEKPPAMRVDIYSVDKSVFMDSILRNNNYNHSWKQMLFTSEKFL